MRVAINLLTDDPANPSGAHWFWTRVIPEMATRSPRTRSSTCWSARSRVRRTRATGRTVRYITFPWSNESPTNAHADRAPLRAGSAAARGDRRLQHADGPDRASRRRRWSCTSRRMHAFTAPEAIRPTVRLVPADELPAYGEGRGCDHHQLGEPAARGHALPRRRPGQAPPHPGGRRPRPLPTRGRRRGAAPRRAALRRRRSRSCCSSRRCGPTRTATACCARSRAAKAELGDRQLVVVGPGRDLDYVAELRGARRRARHRGRRRLGRRRPARGDRALLPVLPTSSRTRPSTRPSGCRSSRRWRRAAPSSPRTRARCRRPRAAAPLLADPHDPESIADAHRQGLRAGGRAAARARAWSGRPSSPGRRPPNGRSRSTARSIAARRRGRR